jgi:hypothetical protein
MCGRKSFLGSNVISEGRRFQLVLGQLVTVYIIIATMFYFLPELH